MISRQRLIASMLLLALLCVSAVAPAAEPSRNPFAEKHVVLQISDANPAKQTLVLNVASNLIKHYGPDKVDVEIVAFGPGLKLMFAENANAGRVNNLAAQGVHFAACNNTMAKMTSLLGKEPVLNDNTVRVTAGVVRIMDLVDEGYTLVRP